MRTWAWMVMVAALGCDRGAEEKKESAASAQASVVPAAAEAPAEPPPAGCRASGKEPVELGTVVGDVHGFAGDATHLYYTSWDIYGNRGDVGRFRKDGEGLRKMGSLQLEPRELAVDEEAVYYTSGIRLLMAAKDESESKPLALQFSSQAIALHGADVYGVPGDYGPYDRVAKVPKVGGEPAELATSGRPAREVGPNGFSSIAVDETGVYVTDSGRDRVLRFPLEGGKPKVLATRQDRAYALALAGPRIYFTLGRRGDLMSVAKEGGGVKKLASGLAQKARIAADEQAVYALFSGEGEDAPGKLSRVDPEAVEVTALSPVPPSQTVDALALDGDCVYWAQRMSAAKTVVYALRR